MLVLLLTFIFMLSYTAIGAPLGFTMFSYAMLWRNARARRQEAAWRRASRARPVRSGPVLRRALTREPGS